MSYRNPQSLVSTAWLAANLGQPDLRVVDASYYLPQMKRDAKAEYAAGHIPGAVYFDIDDISDRDSPYPHMLPSPAKFASRVRQLGLGDGNRIVVYDGSGANLSAGRAWWMFRVFGHKDVAILDGGLKKWRAENRPLEDRLPPPRQRHFTARFDATLVRDIDQMRDNVAAQGEQIVDVRSAGRFKGSESEPRPGLRGGHMPGAINVPYTRLIDPKNGTLLPANELVEVLEDAGVDLTKPIVTTCGSGVSACAVAFALHLIGHREVAVYDGSWAEWGALPDTPIET
jgi:thiosulfate/3-mercaptopyruvate sulfurtransferase